MTHGLPRGFKADANRLAVELRAELGVDELQPIDVNDLADLYGIPIERHDDLDVSLEIRHHFNGRADWSALTVFRGTRRLVVVNSSHPDTRLANSIAHELSHVFLEHDATPVRNTDGTRTWDTAAENQANELAGRILIPNQAIHHHGVRRRWSVDQMATHFDVSRDLAQWRYNACGVRHILHNTERNSR